MTDKQLGIITAGKENKKPDFERQQAAEAKCLRKQQYNIQNAQKQIS